MKLKWAWIAGFIGIAGAFILFALERLTLARVVSIDWLVPAFKFFDYPACLVAPWIVGHLPLITHGDISPNMTELSLFDVFYVVISGFEWFALGAATIYIARGFSWKPATTSIVNQ